MDDNPQPSPWLTTILPLIVGGVMTPLVPNLAVWLSRDSFPNAQARDDFWSQISIYVAMVRWSGAVLLIEGVWLAVQQLFNRQPPNPDAASESN